MRTVLLFTHSLVCIRNLTRFLRSFVRFPILDQLVRKYRTHILSMKYSIYKLTAHEFMQAAVFALVDSYLYYK